MMTPLALRATSTSNSRGPNKPRITAMKKLILVQFLEAHPELVSKHCTLGTLEKNRLWQEISLVLNADDSGGAKDADDWKGTWKDLKHNVKKKALDIKYSIEHADGHWAREHPLSSVEKRMVALIDASMDPLKAGARILSIVPLPDSSQSNHQPEIILSESEFCIEEDEKHSRMSQETSNPAELEVFYLNDDGTFEYQDDTESQKDPAITAHPPLTVHSPVTVLPSSSNVQSSVSIHPTISVHPTSSVQPQTSVHTESGRSSAASDRDVILLANERSTGSKKPKLDSPVPSDMSKLVCATEKLASAQRETAQALLRLAQAQEKRALVKEHQLDIRREELVLRKEELDVRKQGVLAARRQANAVDQFLNVYLQQNYLNRTN